MARDFVPDTSALIYALRQPKRLLAFDRSIRSGRLWLSSVVVAELYAGSRSSTEGVMLDAIVGTVERGRHILTPTHEEWALAGRLLNRRTRLHGAVQPRDHLADLLILVSAARLGGEVVTANLRHFEPWARLAVSAGLDVTVRPLGEV